MALKRRERRCPTKYTEADVHFKRNHEEHGNLDKYEKPAEQGKREADKEILRLESELHKLKTMRQPPQSVATKVHETLLPRANYRESGSVYTKTKPGSLAKANSKADGQLASLKRNLMKTIVKNGIFRKEELNFYFDQLGIY